MNLWSAPARERFISWKRIKNLHVFWICKGTHFLQKVPGGQALHFRALIKVWGPFTLCYKMLSLLLLKPENKSKLKSWLKQILSYCSGPGQQGKQSHPSEDVTQHRGGVTPQPGGISQISPAVHSQLWGSGWLSDLQAAQAGTLKIHQFMLKLLNDLF